MTLYLLPNTLYEEQDKTQYLAKNVFEAVSQIDGLFAESERAGRRYLSHFQTKISFRDIPIRLVNEHTKRQELHDLLKEVNGKVWGLVSDCGLPCIADPGEELVLLAKKMGIIVKAFAGPNACLLALQLSGLNAERFSFVGYLPKEKEERKREIQNIEKRLVQNETVVCMEAPYRNLELFSDLLRCLSDEVTLVIAANLTADNELVMGKKVKDWKKEASPPDIQKVPALFVIGIS